MPAIIPPHIKEEHPYLVTLFYREKNGTVFSLCDRNSNKQNIWREIKKVTLEIKAPLGRYQITFSKALPLRFMFRSCHDVSAR